MAGGAEQDSRVNDVNSVPPRTRWWVSLSAAAIAVAALAAYHNGFQTPFVFDDVEAIADNPTIRHPWPFTAALSPPPGGATVSGRPILNFSFAVNYAISGEAVWSYHALNLAIHIAAGLVLFGIVRRLLVADRTVPHRSTATALAAALLWTLHPLQTESVTYVVQRAESLSGLFYLLTLYCFIRSAEGAVRPRPAAWGVASVASCLLGMATKEIVVTAPVLVLLCDRIFFAGGFRKALQRRWLYYAGLASAWLLLGFLLAGNGGNRGGTIGFQVSVSWWAYALTQFKALTYYLRAAVWPHPLVFEYGTYWSEHLADVFPYACLVAAALALTLFALWRWPRAGFAGAAFFLILSPTSSIVPGVSQMIVEHRMYLPLAAVTTLVACGIWRLGARAGGRAALGVSIGIVLAVAAVFGALTERRNRDYRSALTLWADTVSKRPDNPWAHCNLGVALFEAGRVDEAIGHYEISLKLNPTNALPGNTHTYYNLANAQARTGRAAEAIINYETALKLEPDFAPARCNYGNLLVAIGRTPEGLSQLQAALRLDPNSAKAHNNLGYALTRLGRLGEGIAEYQTALRLRPEDASVSYNLGSALVQTGRLAEAIPCYREALRLRENYPEAHNNLGNALARMGRANEALAEYAAALHFNPTYLEARYNLAMALFSLGRTAPARHALEALLRLKPDFAPAQQLMDAMPKEPGR